MSTQFDRCVIQTPALRKEHLANEIWSELAEKYPTIDARLACVPVALLATLLGKKYGFDLHMQVGTATWDANGTPFGFVWNPNVLVHKQLYLESKKLPALHAWLLSSDGAIVDFTTKQWPHLYNSHIHDNNSKTKWITNLPPKMLWTKRLPKRATYKASEEARKFLLEIMKTWT